MLQTATDGFPKSRRYGSRAGHGLLIYHACLFCNSIRGPWNSVTELFSFGIMSACRLVGCSTVSCVLHTITFLSNPKIVGNRGLSFPTPVYLICYLTILSIMSSPSHHSIIPPPLPRFAHVKYYTSCSSHPGFHNTVKKPVVLKKYENSGWISSWSIAKCTSRQQFET